ncbi:hypothetical protein AGMMS49579_23540 [Spirochaetia bacterium]|nr:hypothetical protein AGMMS49579_23540 [Spirochaetia bacterium]
MAELLFSEIPREVFLSVCERMASYYEPYGFKYSKSNHRLRLKHNEFIFEIRFNSSHSNMMGKFVEVEVVVTVLSNKFKKWQKENELFNEITNGYMCGTTIGHLQRDSKNIIWNVGLSETREKEIENIIETINRLAIPFFNLLGFNSPPFRAIQLGVWGICSPTYVKISTRNLQIPRPLGRGGSLVLKILIN